MKCLLIPIVWGAGMLGLNHVGTGMAGFVFHMLSWPLAWTASLMLGAAAAVKWYERVGLRRIPRVLGTAFGATSALVSFPLGLYGAGKVLSWIRGGN